MTAHEVIRLAMRSGFALLLQPDGKSFQAKATRKGIELKGHLRELLKEHKQSILEWFKGNSPAKGLAIANGEEQEPTKCNRCGSWAYESIRPYGCQLDSCCPFRTRVPEGCEGYIHDDIDLNTGERLVTGKEDECLIFVNTSILPASEELKRYNAQALELYHQRENRQKELAEEKTKAKQKREKGAMV